MVYYNKIILKNKFMGFDDLINKRNIEKVEYPFFLKDIHSGLYKNQIDLILDLEKDYKNILGINLEKIEQIEDSDIKIRVLDISNNEQIDKALEEELKRKYWWLSDYWKNKKIEEKFLVTGTFGEIEIYNFNQKLTEENLNDIREVLEKFSAFKNNSAIENIKYIIFDNEEKINPNDGTLQSGEANYGRKTILLNPNSIIKKEHRIKGIFNFKATLIHELSHHFDRETLLKFKKLFWKKLAKGKQIGQNWQTEIPIDENMCVSEYSKTNHKEDLSDSMVCALLLKEKLDGKKYDFIRNEILGEQTEKEKIKILKDKNIEFPNINKKTYSISTRRKFTILK